MRRVLILKGKAAPLHSTPLHSNPLHSTPLHSTPLHSTPLHSTPLHTPPRHSAPLPSTSSHSLPRGLHSSGSGRVFYGAFMLRSPRLRSRLRRRITMRANFQVGMNHLPSVQTSRTRRGRRERDPR